MIYSRFDIVWPDALNSSEPRSGVDALTFGLATLVMREDLFENVMLSTTASEHVTCQNYSCTKCGTINRVPSTRETTEAPRKLRRGNYFSQFTKKFSLGNGPADLVQEYLVTKESGKMLGTLICLAIARMPNLESFVWDMPTGILRDIWIALSSLGDYRPTKLSRVWVRLHDNKAALQESGVPFPAFPAPTIPKLEMTNVPLSSLPVFEKLEWSNHPTERPNFSTLPPLRSLTVLGIDEISYLEEISQLIGKSANILRELRIGMASTVHSSGRGPTDPLIQCFCLGSELALLLREIDDSYDPRSKNYVHRNNREPDSGPESTIKDDASSSEIPTNTVASQANGPSQAEDASAPVQPEQVQHGGAVLNSNPIFNTQSAENNSSIDPALTQDPSSSEPSPEDNIAVTAETPSQAQTSAPEHASPTEKDDEESVSLKDLQNITPCVTHPSNAPTLPQDGDNRVYLRLETLELEGCMVAMQPMLMTIDFTVLTSLTLLNCRIKGTFWSLLARSYSRTRPVPSLIPSSTPSVQQATSKWTSHLRRMPSLAGPCRDAKYPLSLKRIHTDAVSPELITFLKESLAPDSLEWLFLQDNPAWPSVVQMNNICKIVLRRHRNSLKKVLIDSTIGPVANRFRSPTASKWVPTREAVKFITGGKLRVLRELALNVNYTDWHYFLQRLPNMPQLRSLNVPQVVNHVNAPNVNIKDLAMGVLDVVSLRPEIQLCYLGLSTKRYEILEKKPKSRKYPASVSTPSPPETDTSLTSSEDDETATDEDDEIHAAPEATTTNVAGETSSTNAEQSGVDDWSSSEDEVTVPKIQKVDFKLREILFDDDKISIFKARHGKL